MLFFIYNFCFIFSEFFRLNMNTLKIVSLFCIQNKENISEINWKCIPKLDIWNVKLLNHFFELVTQVFIIQDYLLCYPEN